MQVTFQFWLSGTFWYCCCSLQTMWAVSQHSDCVSVVQMSLTVNVCVRCCDCVSPMMRCDVPVVESPSESGIRICCETLFRYSFGDCHSSPDRHASCRHVEKVFGEYRGHGIHRLTAADAVDVQPSCWCWSWKVCVVRRKPLELPFRLRVCTTYATVPW